MRDIEETNDRASLMVENVTTRLNMARGELSKKERQVHDLSEKYHLSCGSADFNELMDDIECNIVEIRQYAHSSDSLSRSKSFYESAVNVYTDFQKKSESTHECPLCDRSFEHDTEFGNFIQKVPFGF